MRRLGLLMLCLLALGLVVGCTTQREGPTDGTNFYVKTGTVHVLSMNETEIQYQLSDSNAITRTVQFTAVRDEALLKDYLPEGEVIDIGVILQDKVLIQVYQIAPSNGTLNVKWNKPE